MQKTAQKRSLLNKLREMTDVGGIASEKFFHPEFQELMDKLRNQTDDPARALVSGEQIGEAPAPEDGIGLKDLLKSAQSNINRREYMKGVADLGRFHKKVNDLVKILSSFKANIDKVHEKFLFQDLDEESKKHLQELKGRFAKSNNEIVKEANILDFFTNIATERGRALSAWEKRYPKQVSKLKKDTEVMLKRSESMLSTILTVLKEMAKARATRKVDSYIIASEKIIKAYGSYDTEFKKYYADNIKGFLEKQELVAPTKTDVSNKPEQLGSQEVGTSAVSTIPAPPPDMSPSPVPGKPALYKAQPPPLKQEPLPAFSMPASEEQEGMTAIKPYQAKAPPIKTSPKSKNPTVPVSIPPEDKMYRDILQPGAIPALKPIAGPTMQSLVMPEHMEQMPVSAAHQKFLSSLQAMSNENPSLLSAHIKRYARSIQKDSPVIAIQLLKVANSIEE